MVQSDPSSMLQGKNRFGRARKFRAYMRKQCDKKSLKQHPRVVVKNVDHNGLHMFISPEVVGATRAQLKKLGQQGNLKIDGLEVQGRGGVPSQAHNRATSRIEEVAQPTRPGLAVAVGAGNVPSASSLDDIGRRSLRLNCLTWTQQGQVRRGRTAR